MTKDAPVKLSITEKRVLALIATGITSTEAADHLFISKRTVDFHLYRVYVKLGVSNRVQAYRRAVDLGILAFYEVD